MNSKKEIHSHGRSVCYFPTNIVGLLNEYNYVINQLYGFITSNVDTPNVVIFIGISAHAKYNIKSVEKKVDFTIYNRIFFQDW